MTKVDFYILPKHAQGDRFLLACRLVDKIYGQGRRIYVNAGSEPEARHLDRLLWTFRQNSFIPHGMIGVSDPALTPVLVGWERDPDSEDDVLVNLAPAVPGFFSRFARVAELVDNDPDVRRQGRERFRFYRDRGYPLDSHEVSQ